MPHLLGIRIRNYRALKHVELGQIAHGQGDPLPRFACLIGANGSGKSTLLDAFAFLADCLREGTEAACDKPHRGGFDRLRTQGSSDPISFDLYYRQDAGSRPITYSVSIGESRGLPYVLSETLLQRRKGLRHGRPFPFLKLEHGSGTAWSGEETEGGEVSSRVEVHLDDPTRLGITTLGQFKEHPRILGLRAYMEGWYLCYFVPDAARGLPAAGAQKHLDRMGTNLGNYVQYLQTKYPKRFERVLKQVAARIPGIRSISWTTTPDRRLLLSFNELGFNDPFFQQSMSDGTLKYFAYMMLLRDPDPFPFIGIEEPENGLYHRLLDGLARQLKGHAEDENRTQVLVTTHSPVFVDALQPEEVWLLQREEGGVTASRTRDLPSIEALYEEGIPLGSLWFSNHFNELGFQP